MKVTFRDSTVLITGASSGIGKELARILAKDAKALILVARRVDRLEELKAELVKKHPKLIVSCIGCDLTQKESMDVMLDKVHEDFAVDILINNAGFGDMALVEDADWEKLSRMFSTNMVAPAYLTRKLLPKMIAKKSGGILNISSSFGIFFMPGFAGYVGTKYFMTGFTECLRTELKGTGVVVSQLCPGPVATEFSEIAGGTVKTKIPKWAEISAVACAQEALDGFEAGKAMIVPGWMKIVAFLGRPAPLWIQRCIMDRLGLEIRKKALFKQEIP